MDFNKFYQEIVIPFYQNINKRHPDKNIPKLQSNAEKDYFQHSIAEATQLIKKIIDTHSIDIGSLETPLPPTRLLDEYYQKMINAEIILHLKIISIINEINDISVCILFIKILGSQSALCLLRQRPLDELNLYIKYCYDTLSIIKNSTDAEENRDIFLYIKRILYTLLHETRFDYSEGIYNELFNLIKEDLEITKKMDIKNYITTLIYYLSFSQDYLFLAIQKPGPFLKNSEINHYFTELQNQAPQLVSKEKLPGFLVYKILNVFFHKQIIVLKTLQYKKTIIDDNLKMRLLIEATELIKAFYGEQNGYKLFFDMNHPVYKMEFVEILKNFSKQLTIILNDQEKNVLEPLFWISMFLSSFPEYIRLNTNLYNRINFVIKTFYNRKIFVLSSLLYLKSYNDINYFKNNVIKIRKIIEENPLTALITLYNHEIEIIKDLPINLINAYKSDPNLIDINEFISQVNTIIYERISHISTTTFSDGLVKLKLNYLNNFQNEMKNVINMVKDPSLVRELAQFYSYFVDNYIKKNFMEYRADFNKKVQLIKMSLIDINPLYLSIALLFAKIGKLDLIINHESPATLGLKKKNLTHAEKAAIANYLNLTVKYLPKDKLKYNWANIEQAIINLKKNAIENNETAPPESRIIKVLFAIINKITRQDIKISALFYTLFQEVFIPTKNIWDMDPIIILYFSTYFSKLGKKIFYDENSGEKIEVYFKNFIDSTVHDKINNFIKDLAENIKDNQDQIENELEETKNINAENLIDQNGNKKQITSQEIINFFNQGKNFCYDVNFVDYEDQVYILGILHEVFIAAKKSTFYTVFRYIITELITNANKGNLKRAYFKSKNIDMSTNYDYGMKGFNPILKAKDNELKNMISEMGLKVKIIMEIFKESFTLQIINNYQILPQEINFVDKFVYYARIYKNLSEAYKKNNIQTREGKGFGLIIILLLLRKIGLSTKSFQIDMTGKKTIFKITIPYTQLTRKQEDDIIQRITGAVNEIPALPDHIQTLRTMLTDPNTNIKEIEKLILQDSSLTADILKLANSGYYMSKDSVLNIYDAIKIIGTKGIINLLSISSSFKLVERKAARERIEEIIQHSKKTAIYTKILAAENKLNVNIDDLFIISLLHDIGKIVIEGIDENLYKELQAIVTNKVISIEELEDLAGVLNHAQIGALLTQKWKFPPVISQVIKYHHNPGETQAFKNEVYLVYMANIYTYFNTSKVIYDNTDQMVLKFFGLNTPEKFNEMGNKLLDNG